MKITCKNVRWVDDTKRGIARRMVATHIRAFINRMGHRAAFSISETKRLMRQAYAQAGYR